MEKCGQLFSFVEKNICLWKFLHFFLNFLLIYPHFFLFLGFTPWLSTSKVRLKYLYTRLSTVVIHRFFPYNKRDCRFFACRWLCYPPSKNAVLSTKHKNPRWTTLIYPHLRWIKGVFTLFIRIYNYPFRQEFMHFFYIRQQSTYTLLCRLRAVIHTFHNKGRL